MENLTQHEKILIIILRGGPNIWWRAKDFQEKRFGLFVGYEASARISELCKLYSFAFNKKRVGKFTEFRFVFEEAGKIYRLLPDQLRRHLVLEKIIK